MLITVFIGFVSELFFGFVLLCLVAVLDILVNVAETGDWKAAFDRHIPKRCIYHVDRNKGEISSYPENDEKQNEEDHSEG